MTKQQVGDIVNLVFKTSEYDDKVQDSFENLIKTVDENDSHPIISSNTDRLLELLEIIDKRLADELSYFVYEAPFFWNNWEPTTITVWNAIHKIHNQTEAKEYILIYYWN